MEGKKFQSRLERISIDGVGYIKILFSENRLVEQAIRQVGAILNGRANGWTMINTQVNFLQLLHTLREFGYVDYSGSGFKESGVTPKEKFNTTTEHVHPETWEKVKEFQRWLKSKRYSESTIKTYSESIRIFLNYFHDRPIETISNLDLIDFNNDYILKKGLSTSYQNQFVNGIKLFFGQIANKKLDVELIHRPKKAKVLPNVLSKEEVKMILKAPVNVKHRTMLSLTYACGLRCNELIQLRITDIDKHRKVLLVRQGKGRKDRVVPISEKTLGMLRDYYEIYRPLVYLFEGMHRGTCYHARSLQQVIKQAAVKAGIKKPVTLHWLRHSYATHLLESGTNLRYIQELLGHNSSRTTEIYTHVSTENIQNIRSPFDTL